METFNKTLTVQWHITDACDQRCRHCYIYNGGYERKKELSLEQCFSVVENCIASCRRLETNLYFAITGGDPLLSEKFWPILGYLKERKIKFLIMGNPFHITSEVCQRFKEYSCVPRYQMSLDGLKETHDKIRISGSFDSTLKAIRILKENGAGVGIMSTVSLLNYKEIPELIKIVSQTGADSYSFSRYCPSSNDKHLIIPPLNYQNFLDRIWKTYEKMANNPNNKISFPLKDHLWTLYLHEKGLVKYNKEECIVDGCNCAFRHTNILSDGTVYACRRFESPVGNIMQNSLYDIFLGEKYDEYRQINQMDGCKDCELINHCRGCHAVAHCVSGNFFDKDPQCWKAAF